MRGHRKTANYNDIAKEAEGTLQRNDMKPIYRAVKRINGRESSGQGTFPRKLDGTLSKSGKSCAVMDRYNFTVLNYHAAQSCPDLEW